MNRIEMNVQTGELTVIELTENEIFELAVQAQKIIEIVPVEIQAWTE